MPAGRFVLLDAALAPGAELELPPEIAHQTRDVLRLGPGGSLRLLDGRGGEYAAEVLSADRKHVLVRVGPRAEGEAELPVRLVLCQGMLKAAKFELVLQKGTELGVSTFVPLLSERAVAAAEATGEAKRRRWERILAEALEQCGGTRLPTLAPPQPLAALLADRPANSIAIVPWEEERATPLGPALASAVAALGGIAQVEEIRLFIGPEGGFSAHEAALARQHGALLVTLGPRTLRAETAALAAITLVADMTTFGHSPNRRNTVQ